MTSSTQCVTREKNPFENDEEDDYKTKLAFKAEWFDPVSRLQKNFLLFYFPFNGAVEMHDLDTGRLFLRRQFVDGVEDNAIYLGSIIRVHSRQMYLVAYGDSYTESRMSKYKQHTLAIIKPTAMKKMGEILNVIRDNNFIIIQMRMVQMNKAMALDFFAEFKGQMFLAKIVDHISAKPVLALHLVGENAVKRWCELMGPLEPEVARKEAPDCLIAKYGVDRAANGFHGPKTKEEYEREIEFFFPSNSLKKPLPSTAKFVNSTLCIIKPHVFMDGNLGDLLQQIIDSKFRISALQMFYLSTENVEEFLEAYRGAATDFRSMKHSILDGPCVALEITGAEDFNVQKEFKIFVGPRDPSVAKQTRSKSLRALFGTNRYRNSVYCTTAHDDADLEVEYFFQILVNQ